MCSPAHAALLPSRPSIIEQTLRSYITRGGDAPIHTDHNLALDTLLRSHRDVSELLLPRVCQAINLVHVAYTIIEKYDHIFSAYHSVPFKYLF